MKSKATFITQNPQQAAQWLQQGRLLAYPTESVWGIGCDPYNEQAVNQLLAIKNRPIEKGMIVVTDGIERINTLLMCLSETRRQQVIASWQLNDNKNASSGHQAQTWLLPLPDADTKATVAIPKWVICDHDSVAVRVISHPLIRELCQKMTSETNPYGFVVSTSCNPSQYSPAHTFEQAYDYFAKSICYLQGETLGYTLPSQINDAISGAAIR